MGLIKFSLSFLALKLDTVTTTDFFNINATKKNVTSLFMLSLDVLRAVYVHPNASLMNVS